MVFLHVIQSKTEAVFLRAKMLVMGRDVEAAEPQPNFAPGKSQTESLHSHST